MIVIDEEITLSKVQYGGYGDRHIRHNHLMPTDIGNFFQGKRVVFWNNSANIVSVEIESFTEA